jgi:hypothetical protein
VQKIPTIFDRDWDGDRSRVIDKPHRDCGWVFAGEGFATRKLDGTCCMIRDGKLFKRRELKPDQSAPVGFELADVDDVTGKTIGWVPVGDGPEDKWHRAAWYPFDPEQPDGTYELIGPHIQGGAEKYDSPGEKLVNHADLRLVLDGVPRTFDGLRDWLTGKDIEGIVFHHPDGRMAKIKLRDYGLKRAQPIAASASR